MVHPAILAMALLALSCASTRNFLDPDGPRYAGSYAAETVAGFDAPKGRPVRIVTFNIAHARNVPEAIAVIESNDSLRQFDALLLQEMDPAGVEQVARGLRLNYVYFPSSIHPSSDREFGTAVLSPWPLRESRKMVLPHAPFTTRVRRAVTTAIVDRAGLPFRVYSVHLPAPWSITGGSRREQVDLLLDDAEASPGPVVIGGDFNARGVGPWFEGRGFLWLTERLRGTARRLGFSGSFDHVFARGFRPSRGAPAAGMVDSAGASDHMAVWALLEPEAVARTDEVLPHHHLASR